MVERFARDAHVAPDVEITLEANPEDVSREAAAAWRRAGVNRISLGVQSFDPGVLAWMHRTHDAGAPARAMGALRAAGFENVSLDLIFGLDQVLGRDWEADLSRAIALAPEHLSFYGLTVEAHTPLAHWVDRGTATVADEERYVAEFLLTHDVVTSAGFVHYEVSSAGRPGRHSRHNFGYWHRRPFLGLGPSAHSGAGNRRSWNIREWKAWRDAMAAGEDPTSGQEVLDEVAVRLERLYLGLRTNEGAPPGLVPGDLADRWRAEGWAHAGDPIRLTASGWLRLDALVRQAAGRPLSAARVPYPAAP
jgi:oxygen-independent coproporphyrinogen-3 oxidase